MIVRPRQTGQMDPADRSAALDAEGRRLVAVASSDLEADIPSCPGWKAADLLSHVASGWEAFRIMAEAASTDQPDFGGFVSAPAAHEELGGFAAERLSLLVPVLAATDPSQPAWSWFGPVDVGFYQRRALQETVVHRVDAELGSGVSSPVDPIVGFDGVDELFSVLLAARTDDLPSGSFHLHQTDGDGELMLRVTDGAISVSREHAKGDAALRATGEDLLLAVWGRRRLDEMELFGDRHVAEQWIALAP